MTISQHRRRDVLGPRVHKRVSEECERQVLTCWGCPALRIHDFHYTYCRDQGWKQMGRADGSLCGRVAAGDYYG